ncbi:MAG: transcription termination/antitermination protein NusA [Chloroflexi bacterium]|nr:transcription termination/antitermination protein NusA [Chloroflexota bacterium]
MKSDFLLAISQLAAEKNLPREVVLDAVETALASVYKKDPNIGNQNVTVKVLPNTGEVKVYSHKTVVAEVQDGKTELSLAEAHLLKATAQLGDVVAVEVAARDAGRIAAQTAKQVVLQRLREAERDVVFEEFSGKEGDIVSGIVQRIEPKQIVIDLGKAEAILPASEQVRSEHYRSGQRIKAYLLEVSRTGRGPQVVVSRTHKNFVRRLFELEVPEIHKGIVEIKSIAREPGYRSKVAVAAIQSGVDAVGSCVGLRGIRIQNIVNEISGEKIDVVQWHQDPVVFVANALSPAQVLSVNVNHEDKKATVVVPDRQLSLAIGKEGQNARLAAKLSGWRIDIKSASAVQVERVAEEVVVVVAPPQEELVLETATLEMEPVGIVLEALPALPEPAVAEVLPAASLVGAELPRVAAQEEVPEEKPVISAVPWEGKAKVRFAEEVLPSSRGKAKKQKGKKGREEEEAVGAVKAKKRSRVSYEGEDDEYIAEEDI